VFGQAKGAKEFSKERVVILHQWIEQARPRWAVASELLRGFLNRTMKHRRRPVRQRMGQRRAGVDPFQAVPGQRHLLEEGGGEGQRVNRGEDIMVVTRQGQFSRATPAARDVVRLNEKNL